MAADRTTDVSAVVCSRNRPGQRDRAVRSLLAQGLPAARYEVLVIENGSLPQGPQDGGPWPENVRTVREPNPGLSHARNTAIRASRGRYVAFLDDDAVAEGNWLEGVLAGFASRRPPPLAVGGRILPLYETTKPPWFEDRYEERTWGDRPRHLGPGESFSGSNAAFDRDVFERLGGFDPGLGVRLGELRLGEETDFFDRMWRSGLAEGRLWYDPSLVVRHAVPPHKMTARYGFKRAFAAGQSWTRRRRPLSPSERVVFAARSGFSAVVALASAVARLGRYPHWQNWCWEALAPGCEPLGRLAESLSIPVSPRQEG